MQVNQPAKVYRLPLGKAELIVTSKSRAPRVSSDIHACLQTGKAKYRPAYSTQYIYDFKITNLIQRSTVLV